jgi:hypothetical protein
MTRTILSLLVLATPPKLLTAKNLIIRHRGKINLSPPLADLQPRFV